MSEYRLTGLDCSALNDTALCTGYRSVAGGCRLTFSAWDTATRKLTLESGEIGKCAAGRTLYLWTTAGDPKSPYRLKIAAVDPVRGTVTLSADPGFDAESLKEIALWCGAVQDVRRMEAAFASGTESFATGDYSFSSGSLSLAVGFGAHAEGILCEARGDMSFAIGNMTRATGLASYASGTNTEASGMFSIAVGASTKASGDNSIAEGSGSEASGDGARAGGHCAKASGRLSFAQGICVEANGSYSVSIGRQIVNHASGAILVGVYGTLADDAANTGAVAVAGGTQKERRVPLIIRTNKAVRNPLYPQENEKEYLPEPELSVEYAGHLLAETKVTSGTVLLLDHGAAARWKHTPTGLTVPQLANWLDGDHGELVVYNGSGKMAFPAEWVWAGPVAELGTGIDVFRIWKIDETIIIKHEVQA